jgi:hypothetical protein
MTRAERLARSTARAAERTAKAKAAEAQARAKERANDKEAIEKRWVQVGRLAHEAGLLAWENSTLAQLFALLAQLADSPDPVSVLDGLLCGGAHRHESTVDASWMASGASDTSGMALAHPPGGVAAARREGM